MNNALQPEVRANEKDWQSIVKNLKNKHGDLAFDYASQMRQGPWDNAALRDAEHYLYAEDATRTAKHPYLQAAANALLTPAYSASKLITGAASPAPPSFQEIVAGIKGGFAGLSNKTLAPVDTKTVEGKNSIPFSGKDFAKALSDDPTFKQTFADKDQKQFGNWLGSIKDIPTLSKPVVDQLNSFLLKFGLHDVAKQWGLPGIQQFTQGAGSIPPVNQSKISALILYHAAQTPEGKKLLFNTKEVKPKTMLSALNLVLSDPMSRHAFMLDTKHTALEGSETKKES